MPTGIFKHKPHSEETKRKMSLSAKGKPKSEEHKKRMSKSARARTDHKSGINATNWQGGKTIESQSIRNSKKYINWRLSVFKRDEFTCKGCGQVGGRLQAHHIKHFAKYPKLRLDINNGVTLCDECHRQIHK